MNGNDKNKNIKYSIRENINTGEVHISDEVVTVIAALAATEVEGVQSMAGNVTNELASRLGAGKLSKGVRLRMSGGCVDVECNICIKDGYEIPEVSRQVQEKVKNAIETMTGLKVSAVNVRITNVVMDNV